MSPSHCTRAITNVSSNAIDLLCSGQIPRSGVEKDEFDANFDQVPQPFSADERESWLKHLTDVVVSSDAFFPFSDNVYRMGRSGVKYVAAPTGSVNDGAVFEAAEKLGIVFVEQGVRLFHH